MRVAAFLILLVAASLTAMASEVYKWVDEEGNVHYSDTPPENVESERVQVDVAPPRGDASAERVLERAEQTRERLAAERDACAVAEEAEAARHAADRQRCVFATAADFAATESSRLPGRDGEVAHPVGV